MQPWFTPSLIWNHVVPCPVTWVWASSGSWWWTGKPGMLQSMASQRVRHNWGIELNWITRAIICSYVLSISVVSNSLRPHGLQHARLPCPSSIPRACSDSCPLRQWCHPSILSSVIPFSSCLQSFPTLVSFPTSWLFASGGQSSGASASASVLPMNIQDWFPLGLTCLISLLSKGLSRVFSIIPIQKHQFFSSQSPLWSKSHNHTWILGKP